MNTKMIDTTGWLRALALACVLIFLAACDPRATRPDTKAYDANNKVTAAETAVYGYVSKPDCTLSPPPCSNAAYVKKLAQATVALGQATDAYVATVRDPSYTAGGLSAAAVAVDNALLAVTTILLELGITP